MDPGPMDTDHPSVATLSEPGSATARQPPTPTEASRKRKLACLSCHNGKTKCNEVLPCQNCLKRGQGANCKYPDAEGGPETSPSTGPASVTQSPAHTHGPTYPAGHGPGESSFQATIYPAASHPGAVASSSTSTMSTSTKYYRDYNGQPTGASSSTFRPKKRPRDLTEEEAAAITRNFKRGDFYLPVRLTLAEGDHVHFIVGEQIV
ncbi:hypothetical protein DL96DRAFT_1574895 [Flagelloscypha sp. PMI_526]|nr:hypothetical protein DL96DRAFT_1574895 [Flagelloscypha sp. PMI_526]